MGMVDRMSPCTQAYDATISRIRKDKNSRSDSMIDQFTVPQCNLLCIEMLEGRPQRGPAGAGRKPGNAGLCRCQRCPSLGVSPSAGREVGHPQGEAAFDLLASVSARSKKWGLARFLTLEKVPCIISRSYPKMVPSEPDC